MSFGEVAFIVFQVGVGIPAVVLFVLAAMHLKPEFVRYLWLGYWLLNAASVDEEGQRYRKLALALLVVFGAGNFLLMIMLENGL